MATLYTVGYEGVAIDTFVAGLARQGVSCVIDVRANPISRKRGFSQKALENYLRLAGIRYVHLVGLGNTPTGRAASQAGNRGLFRRIFKSHLNSASAEADLLVALRLISTENACLLCFEKDPADCHRALVAETLNRRMAVSIEHLDVCDENNGAGKAP
jgi:uncharacterized protein (DUF488 family)